MTAPVSAAVRRTTVAAVLLVATVAAVVSYAHMQHVAQRSGEAWRSYLLPLSVDGLMVAASMVLLTRRRAGQPGGGLAWCALLAGVGASLAANVAAADPTVTARLVAAWPAVAFAVAFELLLEQRRQPPAEPALAPEPVPVDPTSVAESPTGRETPAPAPKPSPAPRADTPAPAPGRPAQRTPIPDPAAVVGPQAAAPAPATQASPGEVGELAARARELAARNGGKPPGRRVLARELGVTEHAARVVLGSLTPAVTGVGNGAAHRKDDHR